MRAFQQARAAAVEPDGDDVDKLCSVSAIPAKAGGATMSINAAMVRIIFFFITKPFIPTLKKLKNRYVSVII